MSQYECESLSNLTRFSVSYKSCSSSSQFTFIIFLLSISVLRTPVGIWCAQRMRSCFIILLILSSTFLIHHASADFLLDCGSPTNLTLANRLFLADTYASKYLSTPRNILANTSANTNLRLYQTARIFTGPTTTTYHLQLPHYPTWQILSPPLFLPFAFGPYNLTNATFTVAAQQFALLTDFTPSTSTLKEFSINITSKDFTINFNPATNSVAFLNALELVFLPSTLIQDDATLVNPLGRFNGLTSLALQTVAGVNMGGPIVDYNNDTLWRTWVQDETFLEIPLSTKPVQAIYAVKYAPNSFATKFDAPPTVYGTCRRMDTHNDPSTGINVTWVFDVDPGFQYFIRFHYCDIVSLSMNELYFNVFVESSLVSPTNDLSTITGGLAIPVYADYVTTVTTISKLRIGIGTVKVNGNQPDGILNGLEIMKMSNNKNSLDGSALNPSFIPCKFQEPSSCHSRGNCWGSLSNCSGFLIFLFCSRRKQKLAQNHSKTWISLSDAGGASHTMGSKYSNGTGTIISVASNLGYRIAFAAVQEATDNFDENGVIGLGGFGKVYKGKLGDGTKVAVKRGNPRSQQGLAEFRTEIEMLSQFRHKHLVSLIGYCDEKNEMILIYEYMENGTLKSHLYGSGLPSLNWKQRLEVCIGSARGLHYLHTGDAKAPLFIVT